MRVYDSWWPWSIGTVIAVLKTRVRVKFSDKIWSYDEWHVKEFLKESK